MAPPGCAALRALARIRCVCCLNMCGVSDLSPWVFCGSDLAPLSHVVRCAAAACLAAVCPSHRSRRPVGVWHAGIPMLCSWWSAAALGQLSDAACRQEGSDGAISCDIRLQTVAIGARELYLLLQFSSTALGIRTTGTYQQDAEFGWHTFISFDFSFF